MSSTKPLRPLINRALIHTNSARAYLRDLVLAVEMHQKHVQEAHYHLLRALRATRKLKQINQNQNGRPNTKNK